MTVVDAIGIKEDLLSRIESIKTESAGYDDPEANWLEERRCEAWNDAVEECYYTVKQYFKKYSV